MRMRAQRVSITTTATATELISANQLQTSPMLLFHYTTQQQQQTFANYQVALANKVTVSDL